MCFTFADYYLLYMKYTKEILEDAVKKSTSVTDVLRNINCPMSGGGHSHISRKLKKYNIDTSHFHSSVAHLIKNAQRSAILRRRSAKDILTLSSIERRIPAHVLKRALDEMKIEYKCQKCKINSYDSMPITLEVDHINGNWQDNKLENLRYLCPNCHSQMSTCHRKNMKISDEQILEACKKYSYIRDVAKALNATHSIYNRVRKIAKQNDIKLISYLEYEKILREKIPKPPKNPTWRTDPKPHSRKVVRPSKEELEKFIETTPLETLGKNFGVSGNAVKKWCKSYGIKTKSPGYWAKMNFSTNILDSIK
jgi:Zn finger protein HypA/HybF involved in hydrogenase expression